MNFPSFLLWIFFFFLYLVAKSVRFFFIKKKISLKLQPFLIDSIWWENINKLKDKDLHWDLEFNKCTKFGLLISLNSAFFFVVFPFPSFSPIFSFLYDFGNYSSTPDVNLSSACQTLNFNKEKSSRVDKLLMYFLLRWGYSFCVVVKVFHYFLTSNFIIFDIFYLFYSME